MEKRVENDGTIDDSCSICFGEVEDKTFIPSCNHEFCYKCIKEWSKNKRSCPLCNTQFKTLKRGNSGKIEDVPEPSKSLEEPIVASDLYDSSYFLRELRRMLPIVENIQREMWISHQNSFIHSRFGILDRNKWNTVETLVNQIHSFIFAFESGGPFDAHVTFQEISEMQAIIEGLRNPHTNQASFGHSSRYYGADDFDQVSSESEDDFDDEYYEKPKQPKSRKATRTFRNTGRI